MNKEPSLSKLSSRSLSKLKNKIDVAFSRQNNNENQAKNMQEVKPIRSSSTKSLAKSKYESADRNPPFSTTIKNALFQTERKFQSHRTPAYSSRQNEVEKHQKGIIDEIQCKNLIEGQKIVGYCWFHEDGKGISSVSKKCKDQNLRYFAIKQPRQGQQKKRIVAAIEGISGIIKIDGVVYVGNKRFILVDSKMKKLVTKQETQKLRLEQSPFILVIPEFVTSFTNLHKIVCNIFELISDGVRSVDVVTNIIGRKLVQSSRSSLKEKKEQIFILLILMQQKFNNFVKSDKK